MNKWIRDVSDFHFKMDRYQGDFPHVPPQDICELRKSLNNEESQELNEAIDQQDVTKVADACADLIYVTLGTALAFGINLDQIWDEVHRTNMNKDGGCTRDDGKIVKPEGWEPPKIQELLEQQGFKASK